MIEFQNVVKRFPDGFQAVKGLDLKVHDGEICVFIGPSGCGKTTSMRMVNRLLSITEGKIMVEGRDNRDFPTEELRRKIGYAIQQIGLFPHFTVLENIAVVPRLLGWDETRIRKRVDELLELVGLDPDINRDKYPRQLSGGQQQRVGVARLGLVSFGEAVEPAAVRPRQGLLRTQRAVDAQQPAPVVAELFVRKQHVRQHDGDEHRLAQLRVAELVQVLRQAGDEDGRNALDAPLDRRAWIEPCALEQIDGVRHRRGVLHPFGRQQRHGEPHRNRHCGNG